MTLLAAFVRCRKAGAGAEMALMLPLLAVMFFGALEVGYYFYNEHQVIKGVRDGARYAGRQRFASLNCDTLSDGATVPDPVLTNTREVTRTGQLSGGTARVPGWQNSDIDVEIWCPTAHSLPAMDSGIYAGETEAPVIRVYSRFAYEPLFLSGLGVLTTSLDFVAEQYSPVMGI